MVSDGRLHSTSRAPGMHLALCDRDADALASTASEARDIGADVADGVLDVRDPDALSGFFEITDGAFDRLDVLVNVVGGTFRSDFFDVNAKGVDDTHPHQLHVGRRSDPARRDPDGRIRSGGSIMTITSIEAHRAAPRYAVYASMKAAVTHLSQILAVELGPAGIRVNCIAPDIVPTVGMGRLLGAGGRDADDPVDADPDPPRPQGSGRGRRVTARCSWRRTCRRTSREPPFTPTVARSPRPGGCSGREPDGPRVRRPRTFPVSAVTPRSADE